MKTVRDIKQEEEAKTSQLIKDCGVFFAFDKKQFEENKTPLSEGDVYVSTGYGGYMPKSNVEKWIAGNREITTWFNNEIQANNLRVSHILYELINHEAFYTYDIDSTLAALEGDYTAEEVLKVFHAEKHNHID